MARGCPHCGVSIKVDEDKLAGRWGFSDCPACQNRFVVIPTVSSHGARRESKSAIFRLPATPETPEKKRIPLGLDSKHLKTLAALLAFYALALNFRVINPTRGYVAPASEKTDTLHLAAAAPIPAPVVADVPTSLVHVLSDHVYLRSGPGSVWRRVAQAGPATELKLKTREGEWIQVEVLSELPMNVADRGKPLWIRSDLAEVQP